MNWWNQVQDATFNDKGNPFTPGNHLLSLDSIRAHKGWQGKTFLVFTFSVVQADNGIQPGVTRDWVVGLDGENARMSLGDLKGFVFVLFGWNKED